jgi:tetratricopeptide (TPR) repeat protein
MPDWEFYFENGKFFNRSGNYQKALHFFNLALTKKPQDSEIYYQRAFSLEHLGRLDEACRDLFFAFCINPHLHIKSDNPVVWINVCTLLEEHGEFRLVTKLINIAIGRFPENEELLKKKARFQPDRQKKAIEDLSEGMVA